MRIAILGAGAVGRSVAELAPGRGHTVVALADSRSAAIDPDGIDVEEVLDRKATGEPIGDADPDAVLDAPADAVVEATPTTLGDAEPGFSHATRALDADRHVVLANKGPVAERYDDLRAAERDSDGTVRFEATVAGAIPVLGTIEDYGAGSVSAVRGVLNGTANFVLSRMAAEGLDYEHVLAEAQDLGVAEADPTFDVEGTDAALKCVILANVLHDGGHSLDDATVEGIADIPTSALNLAREDGRTVRLIGSVTGDGPSIRVGPRLVPESAPLAVDGTRNLVQLETDEAGRLNLSGRGAGGHPTAAAVLADLSRLSS
jgi:homoserine dehydrogenase